MKHWAQKELQKIHDKRVRNAKPTISMINLNSSIEKTPQLKTKGQLPKTSEFSGRAKDRVSNTAIYRLLKAFKLQQYAKVLIAQGINKL